MYESIKGKLIEKTPVKVIVETYGIGYRLMIPLSTYNKLPQAETEIFLYLSQIVREDSNILYGFATQEERDLFEMIITVSGIGPKIGLGIIGHVEMETFQLAINTGNTQLLSKLPGIGKKTAERLMIEMRDKFKKGNVNAPPPPLNSNGILGDTMNALVNLGYHPLAAQQAARKAIDEQKEEKDLGKIITVALKKVN